MKLIGGDQQKPDFRGQVAGIQKEQGDHLVTPTWNQLFQAVKEANKALTSVEPTVSQTTLEAMAQENRLLREEIASLKAKRATR